MFNGMQDAAWEVIKTAHPWKEKRSLGMPHADFICVLNAICAFRLIGQRLLPNGLKKRVCLWIMPLIIGIMFKIPFQRIVVNLGVVSNDLF